MLDRARLLHLVLTVRTPQNILDASYQSRSRAGPVWSAAEWAEWRDQRAP